MPDNSIFHLTKELMTFDVNIMPFVAFVKQQLNSALDTNSLPPQLVPQQQDETEEFSGSCSLYNGLEFNFSE